MRERLRCGIEDLHAAIRGNIDPIGAGLDGKGDGQPVAKGVYDLSGLGVELQQRPTARRRPEVAAGVEGEVEDRMRQRHPRCAGLSAVRLETVQVTSRRSAADDDRPVRGLGDGHRTDLRVAPGHACHERVGHERPDSFAELRKAGQRRCGRDQLLGFLEQGVRRRRGIGYRRYAEVGRGRLRNGRQRPEVDAGPVIRRGNPERRGLLVAGQVRRQGQELIRVTRLPLEDLRAPVTGHLPKPDAVVAAVCGDVDRHVPDARSILIVRGVPLDEVVISLGRDVGDSQRGRRGFSVNHLRQDLRVFRRRIVEQHSRRGADFRTGGHAVDRPDGVADEPGPEALCIVRRQQSPVGVLNDLPSVRIDGLEQPCCLSAGRIDPCADPKDEAPGLDEIKVALEQRPVGRHVNTDLSDLHVAEPETARIEVFIQIHHDADLAGIRGGFRGILEADRVRQRCVGRQEPIGVNRQWTRQRRQGGHGPFGLEVARQIQRNEILPADQVHPGYLEVGRQTRPSVLEGDPRHVDPERLEMRRPRQVQIVVFELGQCRNRNVINEALVLPSFPCLDLGEPVLVMSVPLSDLLEELDEASAGPHVSAGRAD